MIQDTECSNLTEERWAQYICNHENSVPSRLSPQWLCGNSCTWEHDVRMYIYTEAHQRSCLDQMKILKTHSAQTSTRAVGIAYHLWLSFSINRVLNLAKLRSMIYIYIYIYILALY